MEFLLTSVTVFPLVMSFTRLNWLCGGYLVTKSCPNSCNPMDCCLPGSFQARIREWVAVSFSRGSSRSRDWTRVSCLAGRFFTTEPSGKPMLSFYCQLSMNIWPDSSSPRKHRKPKSHPFRNETLSSDPVSWDRLFSWEVILTQMNYFWSKLFPLRC